MRYLRILAFALLGAALLGLVNSACGPLDSATPTTAVVTVIPTPHPSVAMPNGALTPGAAMSTDVAAICKPGYSSSVRDVSVETKAQVYAEYGVTSRAPGQYEVDHLIPLELGGSNDVKNLWPQPASPAPGFHQKDVLENRLHDDVCSGKRDLVSAQRAIAADWYALYQQEGLR